MEFVAHLGKGEPGIKLNGAVGDGSVRGGAADRSSSNGTVGGQKVVCTPEVSLYQYSSTAEYPPIKLEEGNLKLKMEVLPDSPSKIGGAGNHMGSEDPNANNNNNIGNAEMPNGLHCPLCNKTFQQKNTLQNHLRSHREGDDPYHCDICGKTFAVPARLTRHYRTHTGEKPYQCEYCNKSFSVKENLSVHRRIHTKERPYKCEICERAFEHSGKLHRHMRIHTGERPHRCQLCQKTFIQSGQLVIHMRTHTGEKPYVCKVCNKGFTCSKQLKVHTRTHTGEKPYSCDICGKSFGYNHVLKLHQVAHYGEKVYKCTLCNGTFNSKKALETHIKTHADDPPSSPTSTEPGIHSPSSVFSGQAPHQHSDKENRESSDSEMSQNSPHGADGPRTPPSPMRLLGKTTLAQGTTIFPVPSSIRDVNGMRAAGLNGSKDLSSHGNQNGEKLAGSSNLISSSLSSHSNASPQYPMLPPGVEVRQAPQSKTTFLYVTSKLPVVSSNVNVASSVSSPGNQTTQSLSQNSTVVKTEPGVNSSSSVGPSRRSAGWRTPAYNKMINNGVALLQGSNGAVKPVTDGGSDRFSYGASIRERVLAFTAKFGYGLERNFGGKSNGVSNYIGSDSNPISSSLCSDNIASIDRMDYIANMDRTDIAAPENLTLYRSPSPPYNIRSFECARNGDEGDLKSVSCSPVISNANGTSTSYKPGGVLALALTKGSKAVNKSPLYNSNNYSVGVNNNNYIKSSHGLPANRYVTNRETEPAELTIDLRSGSPHSLYSGGTHSPISSTRSLSPGNDYKDEICIDEHQALKLASNNVTLNPSHAYGDFNQNNKRMIPADADSGQGSSSRGPRKRSSLILEKYAQESAAPKPTESILSQRLRMSSVIQYAEKCT